MRKMFGTLAGIVAAIIIMLAIEYAEGWLYPPVSYGDDDPAAAAMLIIGLPLPAKFILMAGWAVGTFGGAWLALRINDWRWSGVIVALVVIADRVASFVALPYPWWMEVAAVVLPVIGGWLAIRLHHKPYPGEPLLG